MNRSEAHNIVYITQMVSTREGPFRGRERMIFPKAGGLDNCQIMCIMELTMGITPTRRTMLKGQASHVR